MDLVAGVKRVVAVMEHTSKDGSPKILKKCTLPITGLGVVNLIITDLSVFEVKKGGGLVLIELQPGATLEEVRAKKLAKSIGKTADGLRITPLHMGGNTAEIPAKSHQVSSIFCTEKAPATASRGRFKTNGEAAISARTERLRALAGSARSSISVARAAGSLKIPVTTLTNRTLYSQTIANIAPV